MLISLQKYILSLYMENNPLFLSSLSARDSSRLLNPCQLANWLRECDYIKHTHTTRHELTLNRIHLIDYWMDCNDDDLLLHHHPHHERGCRLQDEKYFVVVEYSMKSRHLTAGQQFSLNHRIAKELNQQTAIKCGNGQRHKHIDKCWLAQDKQWSPSIIDTRCGWGGRIRRTLKPLKLALLDTINWSWKGVEGWIDWRGR